MKTFLFFIAMVVVPFGITCIAQERHANDSIRRQRSSRMEQREQRTDSLQQELKQDAEDASDVQAPESGRNKVMLNKTGNERTATPT